MLKKRKYCRWITQCLYIDFDYNSVSNDLFSFLSLLQHNHNVSAVNFFSAKLRIVLHIYNWSNNPDTSFCLLSVYYIYAYGCNM